VTAPILDASALLALLLDEEGAGEVRRIFGGASMTTVNLAEVVSHFARLGAVRADIEAMLEPLPLQLVPADPELSYAAGMLRALTAPAGLSLGDRYCRPLPAATRPQPSQPTANGPQWPTPSASMSR